MHPCQCCHKDFLLLLARWKRRNTSCAPKCRAIIKSAWINDEKQSQAAVAAINKVFFRVQSWNSSNYPEALNPKSFRQEVRHAKAICFLIDELLNEIERSPMAWVYLTPFQLRE